MNRRSYLATVGGCVIASGCLRSDSVENTLKVANHYSETLELYVEISLGSDIIEKSFTLERGEWEEIPNFDTSNVGDEYTVSAEVEGGTTEESIYEVTCGSDEERPNVLYIRIENPHLIDISQSKCTDSFIEF